MLLLVEKGIRGGMCHAIHRYAEANIKYMENYDKNKESSYLMYLDTNNLYGCARSQKLSVNEFKWVKDTLSPYDDDYVLIIMMKIVIKSAFLKRRLINPKIYMICVAICHSCQKE